MTWERAVITAYSCIGRREFRPARWPVYSQPPTLRLNRPRPPLFYGRVKAWLKTMLESCVSPTGRCTLRICGEFLHASKELIYIFLRFSLSGTSLRRRIDNVKRMLDGKLLSLNRAGGVIWAEGLFCPFFSTRFRCACWYFRGGALGFSQIELPGRKIVRAAVSSLSAEFVVRASRLPR